MRLRLAAMLSLAIAAALVGCGKPRAAVVCSVTYGGEVKRLEFPATQSPYAVKAIDIAGRFAFKAIYLTAGSVSVYAYQRTSSGLRLIQEGKYRGAPSGSTHGFTGRQLVYSADERELEYWCEFSR